ncbi:hypothetical protein JXM67_09505 [candidate division WOR-3 bacterium]|nr:hypothetical protein [candidate division WOR-3 bacterium]
MRKLFTVSVVAAFALFAGFGLLGCNKLGGGGASDDVIEELQESIDDLAEDVELLTEVLNELQADYDEHLEEFHGEEPEEKEPIKPKSGGGTAPKTGGGGVKPPTTK